MLFALVMALVAEELRDVFDWINSLGLSSDIVVRNNIRNYVVSLFKLAELIKNETPDKNVKRDITNKTTRIIASYISELKESGQYDEKIKEVDTFIVNGGRLAYLKDTQIKEETLFSVSRLSYDLQKEFEVVDKQLAEEIATPYLQTCVNSDELQEYQKHVIIYADNKMDELVSGIIDPYYTALHQGKYQDVAGTIAICLGNAVLDDVDNIAGSLFRVFIFNKEEVGLLAVADMSKYLFMVNQL